MTDKPIVFEIDGREYEWPGLMTLTVRECRIFHEETGLVWESMWLDGLTVTDLFKREGFLSAMARIAYVREHPEALDDQVKAVIENQPRAALFSSLLHGLSAPDEDAEGKAGAVESGETSSSPTKNEPGSTPNGENTTPETSGNDSSPNTGQQESSPDGTGHGRSDMRSTVPPLRSVI